MWTCVDLSPLTGNEGGDANGTRSAAKNTPANTLCFLRSIGYPVVTLGFGFKSYVSYKMRLRKQKEVQKENEFYMQLLQQALPPEQQMLQRLEREAEEGEPHGTVISL